MPDTEEWVVWNGSLGILILATLGHVEAGNDGRRARLAAPWDVVGPFDLEALEQEGCIAFGECLVMSRHRWREDQVRLRLEAREKRRTIQIERHFETDSRQHREALDLPVQGALDAPQISAAFRRLAKTAHPDAGGSDELYRRIVEARDALMARA